MTDKILIYTDNHFCATSSIVRGRGNKYTLRLENQIKTMEWLVDKAQENNCVAMFCCGDFFDRSDLNAEELSALSEIDLKGIHNYFLVGNHEIGRSDCSFSTTATFLQNDVCEILSQPTIIGWGSTLIYILPYISENDKKPVRAYFKDIEAPNYKYKILLSHNDIKGVQLGKYVTETGFTKEEFNDNFDLVINGHLHNQSWVTEKVLNLGNITGQNFSEDGFKYKHQAILLDLDTLQYELITNPYALNFYKIDWSDDPGIDVINETSMKMSNAVLSLKISEKYSDYLKYRFDPTNHDEHMEEIYCPKNNNILCSRIIVDHQTSQTKENISTETLQLDHIKEFQQFVANNMEYNDIVKSELQEVLN